jgi:hypothetical protein
MPYISDPVFDTLNDDEPMWRNMDLPKFAWLLMNSELFFVRADKLDDPYEGFILLGPSRF